MTEIPEHLLARSKARRSGGAAPAGDSAPAKAADADTAAPAKAAASAPAAAPAAPKKKEEPKLPWVEAAKSRQKIPVWAVAALLLLPIFMVVYATTNDPQSPKTAGPMTKGSEVFATCAGCHGSTGGGAGATPSLLTVDEVFPDPADHIRWVMLGTAGYQQEGRATYGATDRPVGGGGTMPPQITLNAEDLLAVIRYERQGLAGEAYDAEAWAAAVETLKNDENPDVAAKAEEFDAVLESWAALPPDA